MEILRLYFIAMIVVGKITLKNSMSSIFMPYRPIVRATKLVHTLDDNSRLRLMLLVQLNRHRPRTLNFLHDL